MGSFQRRPIRRLMAKNVFSGLVTAWRLAGWPTSCSPSLLKATIEGVVRAPSAFSMTFGCFPSMTATHELVVPRSIPITFGMSYPPCGRPALEALIRHFLPGNGVGVSCLTYGRTSLRDGGTRRLYRVPFWAYQAQEQAKSA